MAQRPRTTTVGNNVRSFDALTLRMRGGSRGGLTPFFGAGSTQQVAGTFLVQHLNTIVTVSRAALNPPNNNFVTLTMRLNYSEVNSPPARDAPQLEQPIKWYEGTAPTYKGVTNVIVGTPDGGGTGQGTADFTIETDFVNVTLTASFVSAGFPGPYFYSGAGQVQTKTQTFAQFFNPAISQLTGSWTVVAGSFIAVYVFNIFYPGP